jgi:hypothetical protein
MDEVEKTTAAAVVLRPEKAKCPLGERIASGNPSERASFSQNEKPRQDHLTGFRL